jgi:hypothetical protein
MARYLARYKLSDRFGGHEVEVLHGFARDDGRLDCKLDSGDVVTVPASDVVSIKPPLPEEPPVGSVVRMGEDGLVFLRGDTDDSPYHWLCAGSPAGYTWEQICVYGTPVRLVPDPQAEPVTLPWMWREPGDRPGDSVVGADLGEVADSIRQGATTTTIRFSPDAARAKALALTTAADQAEAVSNVD